MQLSLYYLSYLSS